MILNYASLSEKGLRENNEDLVVTKSLDNNLLIAICIDGVGGEAGGEVAAAIAAKSIEEFLSGKNTISLEDLKLSMVSANNDIIQLQQNPRLAHMSCCVTAIVVTNNEIMVAHCGDCRLYTYSTETETLCKQTKDHSWVGELLDNGVISEKEAIRHKRRNIINKCLGSRPLDFSSEYIYTKSIPIEGVDRIMLCTDGLYDGLDSWHLRETLKKHMSSEETVDSLVSLALESGSTDNVSVIVIDL